MEETHTRLNTTPSKCLAATNISDNNDDSAIVLAVYTINDAVRAIQS